MIDNYEVYIEIYNQAFNMYSFYIILNSDFGMQEKGIKFILVL